MTSSKYSTKVFEIGIQKKLEVFSVEKSNSSKVNGIHPLYYYDILV